MASRNDLSPEDKDMLGGLQALDIYKPLVKLLNRLVEDQGESILKTDLLKSSDRDLTMAKARFEGAQRLVQELDRVLSRLREKQIK